MSRRKRSRTCWVSSAATTVQGYYRSAPDDRQGDPLAGRRHAADGRSANPLSATAASAGVAPRARPRLRSTSSTTEQRGPSFDPLVVDDSVTGVGSSHETVQKGACDEIARLALVFFSSFPVACSGTDDDPVRSTNAPHHLTIRRSPRERSRPGSSAVSPRCWPPANGSWAHLRRPVYIVITGPLVRADVEPILAKLETAEPRRRLLRPGNWAAEHAAPRCGLVEAGQTVGNAGDMKSLKPALSPKKLRKAILKEERALLAEGSRPGPFMMFDGCPGPAPAAGRRMRSDTARCAPFSGGKGTAEDVAKRVLDDVEPGSMVELRADRPSNVAALGKSSVV